MPGRSFCLAFLQSVGDSNKQHLKDRILFLAQGYSFPLPTGSICLSNNSLIWHLTETPQIYIFKDVHEFNDATMKKDLGGYLDLEICRPIYRAGGFKVTSCKVSVLDLC